MRADALVLEAGASRDIARLDRSSVAVLASAILDPLRGLPAATFEAKMAVGRNFGRLRCYVSDPALIHEAIVRTAESLDKGEEMTRVLGPALGMGLLTADGAHWRWQRQSVAPVFQHERLNAFLPAMLAAANATRERWLAQRPGSEIDIGHDMMQTTYEIIVETMLSGREALDADSVERNVTTYLHSTTWRFALALLKAPEWMPFPGSRRAGVAARLMRGSVRDMIAARRRVPRASDDIVSRLLAAQDPESGRTMSDEEITDNILTFIGAGHETTAIALGWTFMLLAEEQDCVARIRAEIEQVTGGGAIEPRHVHALGYTRQVISEAMRLYPPAPLISRTVRRPFRLGGLDLPVGSTVIVPIYAVHRHVALWEDPERFDPARFAPEAIRARHRYAYMPFGAGPRICIGSAFAMLEAVAILATLVRAVDLSRVSRQLPQAAMRVTLRPATPLRMRIAPRG